MSEAPKKQLPDVVREDGRYPLEAFGFLHDGLARAVKAAYGEDLDAPAPDDELAEPTPRHVTGQQFCQGLRSEAIERWGLMARSVLARWNIHATIDFGHMVYLLIANELMQKSESDSLEDFTDVYDFRTAFGPEVVFEAEA